MKLKHLRIFLLIPILFNLSCTAYKQVPYFQDLRRDTLISEEIKNFSPLTLQSGDLIGLNVTSLNHDADLMFNYNLTKISKAQVGAATLGSFNTEQSTVYGYLVDQDGNITLPLIGAIKVSGFTTKEVSTQLEEKLQTLLSKPSVVVRMLNFKISILGDVKTPGNYTIPNEKVTLTEALSLAGDLNSTGIRSNVLLVRETDGKRTYVTVDLTSKKIFNSPYYYLKNNDVLYVQPNRSRAFVDDAITSKISVLIGALSILVLVLKK